MAVLWAGSDTHDSAGADDDGEDDDAAAARRINTHTQQANCSGAFMHLLAGLMMTACMCLKRSFWMCMRACAAAIYLIPFLIQPVSLQHAQMREDYDESAARMRRLDAAQPLL